MCDCIEYGYYETTIGAEEKEPQTIIVPLQVVRARRK